ACMALPVAIPPAAINGICTCCFTIGIRVKVVVSSLPLCPPASKPSATTASTPASCAFKANLVELTTCTTVIPFSFNQDVQVLGFPAEVNTIFTPSSTIIFMISSMLGYNIGTLTPKGLSVTFLHFWMCSRNTSGYIDPAPIKPNPPALLTAAANLYPLFQIIPP